MKTIIYGFALSVLVLFFASVTSAQCSGNVYTTSLSWQTATSVHGFTSTELDYCAGLYYDPANSGSFVEGYGTGSAVLGTSYTQGYADSVPAELNFDSYAPVSNGTYTTNGNHYVIAYYQVFVPVYYQYYWYDPFDLGFSDGGGDPFHAADQVGYWGYATYWVSSPQYVGTTVDTITYAGQTFCLPGQQFAQTGQACSSLPGCEAGLQFSSTGEVCPNYVPPIAPPNEIGVTVAFEKDELRPRWTTGSSNTRLSACLVNLEGNAAGFPVMLELESVDFDAGHEKAYHIGKQPVGNLGRSKGVTNSQGCFETTYTPSHISGRNRVKATILNNKGQADVWVVVNSLVRLEPGENYRLNGAINSDGDIDCNSPAPDCTSTYLSSTLRKAHPSNHWVDPVAMHALVDIANDYKAKYYGGGYIPPAEMVTYNDASLKFGGKFDLGRKWSSKGSHDEHREGKNVDTRSSNIPSGRQGDLIRIFANNNFGIHDERQTDAPHFHLRWDKLGRTQASDQLQNGIDPNITAFEGVPITPSGFASNGFDVAFERSISQDEFEFWNLKLVNAKSQGPAVFLQELTAFYRQLFSSPEYASRLRTDSQFVQDVFGSHLLREPTAQELSYWTVFLMNIGGGNIEPTEPDFEEPELTRAKSGTSQLSQTQKRLMFLTNFESLPQYKTLVERAVNDTVSEPLN